MATSIPRSGSGSCKTTSREIWIEDFGTKCSLGEKAIVHAPDDAAYPTGATHAHHSIAQRFESFWGWISTTSAATRRFHPGAFTLTFGMHSISSGFGSRISTTNTTTRPTAFSRLKHPGNLHGTTAFRPIDAMRSTAGIDPHLSDSQHFESFRRPVIHNDRHNMTAARP